MMFEIITEHAFYQS